MAGLAAEKTRDSTTWQGDIFKKKGKMALSKRPESRLELNSGFTAIIYVRHEMMPKI